MNEKLYFLKISIDATNSKGDIIAESRVRVYIKESELTNFRTFTGLTDTFFIPLESILNQLDNLKK